MTLTSDQQFEMYADIKVIKNNCLTCKQIQKDHEKRIGFLERAYWIFVGISAVVTFVLPFVVQYILGWK